MRRRGNRCGRAPLDWQAIRERLQAASQPVQSEQQADAILARRASLLARASATEDTAPQATLEVIQFSLGGGAYAVANHWVAEACRMPPLTTLPGAPAFILGIVNLRGSIYAVNDLAALLGVSAAADEDPAAHSLLVLANTDMELALRVDQVTGVTRLPAPSGSDSANGTSKYVIGVCADGVALLDGDRLLTDKNLIVSAE